MIGNATTGNASTSRKLRKSFTRRRRRRKRDGHFLCLLGERDSHHQNTHSSKGVRDFQSLTNGENPSGNSSFIRRSTCAPVSLYAHANTLTFCTLSTLSTMTSTTMLFSRGAQMTTTFASHHQNKNTFKSGKSSSIVTRRRGFTSSFTSQKLARKSRRTLKVNASSSSSVEKLRFLSPQEVKQVR